jgi:hypothetical protein
MDDRQLRELTERRGYLRAELRLTATSHGGRTSDLPSGYRAAWDFGELSPDGLHIVHDAPLVIEDGPSLAPGQRADVRLVPLKPEHWASIIDGAVVGLREGSRLIGEATLRGWMPGIETA